MAGLRTAFFGSRVPAALGGDAIKKAAQVPEAALATIIGLATEHILGVTPSQETVNSLLESDGLSQTIINDCFSLVACVLLHALRHSSLKAAVFKEDLVELGLDVDIVDAVAQVIYGNRRPELLEACKGDAPRCPQLKSLKWRVDATISTNTLAKVLKPTVTMQTKLSTGVVETFEVPLKQLHELRYSVAQILKEMDILESRNIFKLVE